MATLPDNGERVKRFRALKATLRTDRSRLLVGIDVAQAAHVVHLRHAHTRVVVPTLTIPNTTRGFTQLWARIQHAQRSTGCREVVVGLEPTGTYHQAVAEFLAAQGADVLWLSSSVAYWHRRTQDGTWDKSDPKDAANCVDLLEQGKVLFYSQPTGPLADLRRLVKVLRRARAELASCKARWRTTLRPALAPMGAPLPNRLRVELPTSLQAWERPARGHPAHPQGRLPLGLATACQDLGAQVTAVQARIAALEAALTPVAERLPAYALLRTIPGIGPTVGAILVAEIGDIAWYTQFSQLRKLAGLDIVRVQSGQYAGQQRISKCGRSLLRWALVPGRGRPDPDRRGPRPARRGQSEAARGPVRRLQSHGRTRGETAPARVGGVAERPTVRANAGGRRAAAAALIGLGDQQRTSPGSWQRVYERGGSHETARGHRRAAPALSSPDKAGWVPRAARRPDGTTTMGRERSPGRGPRGRPADATCEMRNTFCIERRILP